MPIAALALHLKEMTMSRRIILCIDGTNNYPNGGYTNIQRLFRMLVRDEQQLSYYQPGVGTIEPGSLTTGWGRWLATVVDGASAWYLKQHVCYAYRYLMANYRPGDQICLFGFSRGAFCARVLAGMISKIGILHPGFDALVDHAWKTYCQPGNQGATNQFRLHYGRYVKHIGLLGLFDTVSAVGLPWVPKTFPHTARNFRVDIVRHALALDERRVMFVQNRWRRREASASSAETGSSSSDATDLKQVWFPGVHSDVGGGYPETEAGLSLIPLAWMVREAQAAGLRFKPKVSPKLLGVARIDAEGMVEQVSQAHFGAPMHDELVSKKYWRIAEQIPIPRRRSADANTWRTEWIINKGQGRHAGEGAQVHHSARLRMGSGYTPRATLMDPEFVW